MKTEWRPAAREGGWLHDLPPVITSLIIFPSDRKILKKGTENISHASQRRFVPVGPVQTDRCKCIYYPSEAKVHIWYFLTRVTASISRVISFGKSLLVSSSHTFFPIQFKKNTLSVLTFRGAEREDFLCPFFSSRRFYTEWKRKGKFLSGLSRCSYDFIFWTSLSGGCVMKTNVGTKKKIK